MRLQKQPRKLNDMKESDPLSLSYLREQNRLNVEALLKIDIGSLFSCFQKNLSQKEKRKLLKKK